MVSSNSAYLDLKDPPG